jgi:hypothetical protein
MNNSALNDPELPHSTLEFFTDSFWCTQDPILKRIHLYLQYFCHSSVLPSYQVFFSCPKLQSDAYSVQNSDQES